MSAFVLGDLIYENPLSRHQDVADFIREGQPVISFPQGRMRLENGLSAEQGQAANYLFWCPKVFPADIAVRWEFRPFYEPGLAMFWIAAMGKDGKDLFDPSLAKRDGNYRQYHSGDINAYHLSYFRRKNVEHERTFHTCNMRKSCGFHLVTQGGDPIPSVEDIINPYTIQVIKCGNQIQFSINDLVIYDWTDDGETFGPLLGEGYIGFRQMAPLIAEYANLTVHAVTADS